MTKAVSLLTAFAVALPMIPAEKLNATSNEGGDIQKFPESYRAKLQALKQAHPSWSFEPLYTNLDWNDALTKEYDGDKCLVWAQAEDILKSNAKGDYNSTSGSYVYKDSLHWVKTTKDVTAYFMDPRNWLNEENVFMFEDISANGQTLSGVQSIIAGSFMDGNYADVVDDTEEETTTEKKNKTDKKKKDTASIEPVSYALLSAGENDGDGSNQTSKNDDTKVTEKETSAQVEETPAVQEQETKDASTAIEKKTSAEKKTTKKSKKVYIEDDVEGEFDEDDDFEEETKKKRKKTQKETEETQTTEKETKKSKKDKKSKKKGTITYAEAIYQAGMDANVNPYYLASKIIQEVGRGGSDSVSGHHGSIKGLYNFYNIGASDSADPISNGLNWAGQSGDYGRPWNTPYKSIMGGAQYIADKFMKTGQKCGYLLRFNVNPDGAGLFSHQYMTNIGGAAQESIAVRNTYEASGTLNSAKRFIIPVFENMPVQTDEVDISGDNKSGTITNDCDVLAEPGLKSQVTGRLRKGKRVIVEEGVRTTDSYSFDSLNNLYYYKITYRYKGKLQSGYVPYQMIDMPVTAATCKGYTYDLGTKKDYYYQSENSSIATVSDDGIVTMQGTGETRIFAFNGLKFMSIHVVCVKDTDANKSIGAIDIGATQISLRCGEQKKIETNCDVTWKNSNSKVAEITSDGTLIAKKYGKTILKATCQDLISTVEVLVRPGQVEDFHSYLTQYDQIRLKWKKTEDAKGYVIYRRVQGHDYQKYAVLQGDSKIAFVDKKVKEGKTYDYRIQSVATNGKKEFYSKPVTITAKAATGTPENAKVTYTDALKTHISTKHIGNILTWKKVPHADGYQVYRKTKDGEFEKIKVITESEVENYADTDVQTENTYTYKIRAYKRDEKDRKKVHFSDDTEQLQVELPKYEELIEKDTKDSNDTEK